MLLLEAVIFKKEKMATSVFCVLVHMGGLA